MVIKRKQIDLATLYPTPKTYDEVQAERIEHQERNKPRHVASKAGLSCMLLAADLLGVYYLCRYIITDSLVSSLNVIIGICAALFVLMLGLAILKYLFSRLRDLLYTLQAAASVYATLFMVFVAGVVYASWLSAGNWVVILAALAICFAAASLSVATLEGRFR